MTAEAILRAYGLDHLTRAEQRARAGVLDRMGTFTSSERIVLTRAGILQGWTAADVTRALDDHDRRQP